LKSKSNTPINKNNKDKKIVKDILGDFINKKLKDSNKNNFKNILIMLKDLKCVDIDEGTKKTYPHLFINSFFASALSFDEAKILNTTLKTFAIKKHNGIFDDIDEMRLVGEILARGFIMGVYASAFTLSKKAQIETRRLIELLSEEMKFKNIKEEDNE